MEFVQWIIGDRLGSYVCQTRGPPLMGKGRGCPPWSRNDSDCNMYPYENDQALLGFEAVLQNDADEPMIDSIWYKRSNTTAMRWFIFMCSIAFCRTYMCDWLVPFVGLHLFVWWFLAMSATHFIASKCTRCIASATSSMLICALARRSHQGSQNTKKSLIVMCFHRFFDFAEYTWQVAEYTKQFLL